jgi:hypothetical protein
VRKLLDARGQGSQVAEWERELNALVYELYDLTEEEIAIVVPASSAEDGVFSNQLSTTFNSTNLSASSCMVHFF